MAIRYLTIDESRRSTKGTTLRREELWWVKTADKSGGSINLECGSKGLALVHDGEAVPAGGAGGGDLLRELADRFAEQFFLVGEALFRR
jgi:hypothetical protein